MDKGPEKYTVYEFYIEPIINLLKGMKDDFGVVFLGNWMCDECKMVHSRRVKSFGVSFKVCQANWSRVVCSKCRDREE